MVAGGLDRLKADVRRGLIDLWINGFVGSPFVTRDLRSFLLQSFGINVEGRANIYPGVRFRTASISFGRYVMVNEGVVFDNTAHISIGNGVAIGHQAILLTTTHKMANGQARAGAVEARSIVIEDGCWIGARVTVLPGVTLRRGCVIAAGATVTRDTEPDGLYVGTPARRVKELSKD